MKKTLVEDIHRIHTLTYGNDILSEQNFLDKISHAVGFSKIDEPNKADLVTSDVDSFIQTLEDAANSGGLLEEKKGSMKFKKGVESVQIGLLILGYDLPVHGVDGLFGPETATAIDRFKKENRVPSDNTNATPETIRLLINQLKSKNISSKQIKPYVDKVVAKYPKKNTSNLILHFFVQKGLTPEQASGIAGNLYQESRFKPNIVGDNGKSYGIAQWRDTRLHNLKQLVPNWNTLSGQLNFIWKELNTTENKALQKVKQTSTPQDAASIFAQYYERPASSNYNNREMFANNIYNNYKKHTTS